MFKTTQAKIDAKQQALGAAMRTMEVDQWKYLVARIDDPATARLVVEFLDNDPALKGRYAGIYIRARDTVQRARVRYAIALKWGQRIARLWVWMRQVSKTATPSARAAKGPAQRPLRKESALAWPELNAQ